MKKYLSIFLLCVFLLLPGSAYADAVKASGLTGGTDGCLDSVLGGVVSDGDWACVVTGNATYFYQLDADSGLDESSPDVIMPDTNAGDKRWILIPIYPGSVGDAYDTIPVSASAMSPALTSGFNATTMEVNSTIRFGGDYAIFNSSVPSYANFHTQMPESWDLGTLKVKFVWFHNATDALLGNTTDWAIRATSVSDGDSLTGASWGTTAGVYDEAGYANATAITNATGYLTVGNTPAASDMIYFQVFRNTTSSHESFMKDTILQGLTIQFKKTFRTTAW